MTNLRFLKVVSARATLAAMLAMGALLMSCCKSRPPARLPKVVPVPNVSPFLAGPTIQGVAVDPWGDYYVTFTNVIAAYDSNWNLLWKNSHPFSGIPVPVNHIGDFEYYNGLVYAVVEDFKSCTDFSPVLIVEYDANTGALVNWVDITADNHEASAATVVPDLEQVVISSYCPTNGGASTFWNYDLEMVNHSGPGSAVTTVSTTTLSSPVPHIQGISWDRQTAQFLMSADVDSPAGTLWLVSGTGTVTGPAFIVPASQGIELEGVDATTGNAYYAENGYIYGIEMPTGLAQASQDYRGPFRAGRPGNVQRRNPDSPSALYTRLSSRH